jgi:hypothetical protein
MRIFIICTHSEISLGGSSQGELDGRGHVARVGEDRKV